MGTELDFVSLVPLVLRADPLTEIPGPLSPFDVVCPSSNVCIVMGYNPASNATLTVITDGVPGPTQLIPDVDLEALTCVSPTSCFAVGRRTSLFEGLLVPITNGVVGTPQAVPGTRILYGVACGSATSCVAVGLDFAGSFPPGTAVVVPITGGIAGPPQHLPGAMVLRHVTCPSATSCFAIGRTNDVQGVLVPITNGVAGPTQVVAGTDYLNDIACPSPSACVVAGGLSFATGGFVVAVTDGTAGPVQPISPDVDLYSVACTDASHCVAVGDDVQGGFDGVVVAIDNGVAGPVQKVPGTGLLVSVACSTSCVAVGSDSSFNFDAIVPISGGVPGSAQYTGGASVLWEIACGAGGCMAVGDGFPGSGGGFLTLRPAATPAISTLASPAVPAGGRISDSATLTGGFAPTGTVTFTLYGPGDATCSNALHSTTVPVGAGGVSHSGDVEAGAAGTYNWVATYSGDLNNLPVSSACGSEPVVITGPDAPRARLWPLGEREPARLDADQPAADARHRGDRDDPGLEHFGAVRGDALGSAERSRSLRVGDHDGVPGEIYRGGLGGGPRALARHPSRHHDRGGAIDLDHALRRVHGGGDDRLPQDRLDGRDRHTDARGSQYARDRGPGLAGAQRAGPGSHRRPHGQRDPPERQRRWPGPDEPRRGLGQERHRQLPLTVAHSAWHLCSALCRRHSALGSP